jgi:hypothetical protein
MATLLGVPIPVNSVGRLPETFLNTSGTFWVAGCSDRPSGSERAAMVIANAEQVFRNFQKKVKHTATPTSEL